MTTEDTIQQFLHHHPQQQFNPRFVRQVKAAIMDQRQELKQLRAELTKLQKRKIQKENP